MGSLFWRYVVGGRRAFSADEVERALSTPPPVDAFYCKACGHAISSESLLCTCPACGGEELTSLPPGT